MVKLEDAMERVQDTLSPKRYEHSVNVMKKCEEYAGIYGADVELCKLMGILHDVGKELSKEEKVKYCRDNKIPIDEIELENPGLLHGKIAADMAKKEYNLPKEAQDAIIYHTTGRANMTIYDKILFVADSTSIDRKYENTDYFRHIAKEDLDEACIEILKFTIKDRVDEEKLLHINSVYALNYLLKEKNNK